MRRVDFQVPIYDWTVTIITIYNQGCKDAVQALLRDFKLPQQEKILNDVSWGNYNGGVTFTKKVLKKAVIIIFPWTEERYFVRTINHEKRHLVDEIIKWHGVEDGEAAAYLDGFISEEIYKRLNELR